MKEVRAEEAKKLLSQGKAVLLDVREKAEIEGKSANEDYWVPLGALGERFEELPRNKMVLVICRTGNRSAHATKFLEKRGFDAANVKGGILAWER